jgi:hypothetical protein
MTRREYMAALEYELRGIGASAREDALREMESHIDELAVHKPDVDEAELIGRLTVPAVLGRALREQLGADDGFAAGDGFGSNFEKNRRNFDQGMREMENDLRGLRTKIARTIGEAVSSIARSISREEERRWSGEFQTSNATALRIRIRSGDIRVEATEAGSVEADINLEGDEEALAEWKPRYHVEGAVLVLELEAKDVLVSSIRLRVPGAIRKIELGTVSGDVHADLPGAGFMVVTKSGDVWLEKPGEAGVRAVSGDILVEGAQGKLDIETVSGDVRVHDPCSGAKIVTVSGDVVMEEVSGEVCVGTTSGDIAIRARPDFRGGTATSSSGDLEMELGACDLGLEVETLSGDISRPDGKEGGRRWKGGIGSGGPAFILHTVSGDIRVGG